MTAHIRIENLGQVFEADGRPVVALRDIDLAIGARELVCLLGPSGCGKSTLLNAVAGFVPPTSGRVLVDDVPVTAPGPDRGMVFQEYALFPWMTVADNVGFGLRMKRVAAAAIRDRVAGLLAMLGLGEFADRYPKDLSGGMRQRVAIARVLAIDSPILFVTHSIEESIYLADRIVVMTYRPGTIKRELRVELPRPRDPSSPGVSDLARELAELVMAEQRRHEAAERAG